MRLLLIFTLLGLIIDTKSENNDIIYINEKSGTRSELKCLSESNNTKSKLFWSFKRIYSIANTNTTQNEISQQELMISLDSEVQDNLKSKFSLSSTYDLIISNLSYTDSGLYKCNLWNQKTIFYHLTVFSPIQKPEISTQNKSTHTNMLDEGSSLIVKCVSRYSYPYPIFKWFRNNAEIKTDSIQTGFKLLDKETNSVESSILISSLNSTYHLSNISCKTFQSENSDQETLIRTSDLLSLNVSFKPALSFQVKHLKQKLDFFENNSQVYLYQFDSSVQIECKYESNPIRSNILWKMDGNILNFNNSIVLNWSRLNYDGKKRFNLSCQVENLVGKSELVLDIIVLYEPKAVISSSLNKVYNLDENGQFQLNCLFDSSPNISRYEWRKSEKLVSNTSLLDLKLVKHKENSGIYECFAFNQMKDSFGIIKLGSGSQKTELNIRFVPSMSVKSKKQAVNSLNINQSLSCMTMSNPKPDFIWYKNGQKINSSFKYSTESIEKNKNLYESILFINNVSSSDLAKYECEAVNELGASRIGVELVSTSRPDQPTELRVLFVDFMSMTLAWSPGFDGGLEQTFLIQLNESVIELNSNEISKENFKLLRTGNGLLNITQMRFNSVYSIRLKAKNSLGSSDWSDYLLVKTNDLLDSDRVYLPEFDSLFLNVPKNRIEYKLKIGTKKPQMCFNMSQIELEDKTELGISSSCLDFNITENVLSLSSDFNSKLVKKLKISICFKLKPSICHLAPFNAIIDTYNKISHSSLLSNKNDFILDDIDKKFSKFLSKSSNTTIPIALIIGISICILTLIILLFSTIIYCIRKRNFKLCKALLSDTNNLNKKSDTLDSSKSKNDQKSHTNKTFNIDIASISAPVASTVSISGSQLTNSTTSSDLNSNLNPVKSSLIQHGSTRRAFTAALTQTATSIIKNNTLGRNKISEILVTEDEEQQNKILSRLSKTSDDSNNQASNTSSTGVSNCSSTNIAPYIFADYTVYDQQITQAQIGLNFIEGFNTGTNSTTGSNSDPIAINNSLSSNSTTDSPIYGYNIACATNAHNLANNEPNEFMFAKPNQEKDNEDEQESNLVRQQSINIIKQQRSINSKNNKPQIQQQQNHQQIDQPTESGYSTPSRPKKVVYEVIV